MTAFAADVRETQRRLPDDVILRQEKPDDSSVVDALYASIFGPGRFARTAYRIREGTLHDPTVSFVVHREGPIFGAIRQYRVRVGEAPAFLLGPLAVAETAAKQGIGRALLNRSIRAAHLTRAAAIVLVGDEPFYGPSGFQRTQAVDLGGPVEPGRLLLHAITGTVAGSLVVEPWPD